MYYDRYTDQKFKTMQPLNFISRSVLFMVVILGISVLSDC